MPEDLTVVPMDASDREHLMVILRDPDSADLIWVRTFIARYDIARSVTAALGERPERVANVFACNPDEGAYTLDDPKHPEFHSVHADLWDLREGK